MNRERPIQLSVICGFFLFIHLFPTAPLLHHFFQLAREFSQGGMEQMYSAYKATVKPETFMLCARLGLVFVGLMGLWRMKTWGLFMLTAGVAWALWLHYQTGVFSLLSFKLPIIALAASFYYCFRKPANKVSRPDVHYYSGVGIDKETDSSEGAENQSEDKNTSSKKGSDTSENKSALEELIY